MSQTVQEQVAESLQAAVGEHIVATYTYPTAGDVYVEDVPPSQRLLLVLHERSTLHALRNLFLPLWRDYGNELGAPPVVATLPAFRRSLELDPVFASHLAALRRCLYGDDVSLQECPLPAAAQRAYLAQEAFVASVALVPMRLSPPTADAAYRLLQRLVRPVTGKESPTGLPAPALFAAVQLGLRPWLERERLPALADAVGSVSYPIVYRLRERRVLLIEETEARQLLAVDWQALAEGLGAGGSPLHVATPRQLRAAIAGTAPLDYVLRNFEHERGTDLLNKIDVAPVTIARSVALRTSNQLLRHLPGDYLTAADDDAVHRVIHDYQNKLLNTHLQHELLSRIASLSVEPPEESLPGPEAPLPQRIDAILAMLNLWAERYARLALSQSPSSTAPPG